MQAVIYKIQPFDAAKGTTIYFSWNGNQAYKNRCIIQKNDTGEQVYDQTIESFKLEHPIKLEQATLKNGTKYDAFITVFDHDGTESDRQSVGQPFLCLSTPTFQFRDLTPNQIIKASTFQFILDYSQAEGEPLDFWSITLYTREHTELATSGVRYTTESMSHTFSGFGNRTEYSIRGEGQTVNGYKVDTGYINFTVTYETANVFSLVELTNLPKIGAIQVKSNIASAEGHMDHEPPEFIDDEYLDLRDNAVTYTDGFSFNGDFSQVVYFLGGKPNKPLITLYGDPRERLTVTITLRMVKERDEYSVVVLDGNDSAEAVRNDQFDFGSAKREIGGKNIVVDCNPVEGIVDETGLTMKSCFELKAVSNGVTYVRYSRILPYVSPWDKVGVCFYRQNGLFDIEAINFSKEEVSE